VNAEYFYDLLVALKAQGVDLFKVRVRAILPKDGHTILDSNGTVHVNVDKDSVGTFTVEFVPDED